MITPTHLLEIKNCSKTFSDGIQKHQALKDISLHFPKGTTTGLIGHNGAGKSTTICAVLGLIRLCSGRINYCGQPLRPIHRKQIGYLPETTVLPANLTPCRVIDSFLRLMRPQMTAKDRHNVTMQYLEQNHLTQKAKSRLGKLSKGQARKISWILATIHEPELVILDEPFTGLDPLATEEHTQTLRNLQAKGVTLILCSHTLDIIDRTAQRIYLLQKGRCVYEKDLCDGTDSGYSVELQASSETVAKLIAEHPLPKPTSERMEAGSAQLHLAHYDDLKQWLTVSLHADIPIINCRQNQGMDREKVINYFKQEG